MVIVCERSRITDATNALAPGAWPHIQSTGKTMSYAAHAMPQTSRPDGARSRHAEFAAAMRHSRHVRILKRLIVIGSSITVVTLLGFSLFNPFSSLPKDVSISNATLNGTKITMELPKLSGFRKDGRPYEVRARSGTQDVRNPKVIELDEIEARFQSRDKTFVNLTAPAGVFDSAGDVIKLRTRKDEQNVRITSTSGYAIMLKNADVNFKEGTVESNDPVQVKLTSGTIQANSLKVVDNGKKITFAGDVKTVLNVQKGAPELKGATEE